MPRLQALRHVPGAFAHWLGLSRGAGRADGRILMLHGVLPRAAGMLERQLRFLKRAFEVVPLERLLDAPRARQVALTFDDGLRNNVTVAYPVLARLGLPATFFVCPQLVDEGRWLWNHEARQRLRSLEAAARRELALEAGAPEEVEGFVEHLKTLPLAARRAAEARIREATPAWRPSRAEREAFDLAGWDELRALDPALVTIGSHTLTHPILPRLAPAEIRHEVGESRRVLEARLERPVALFAYPNGDACPASRASARCNYAYAVAGDDPGLGWSDRYLAPRLAMPHGVLRLASRLNRPAAA